MVMPDSSAFDVWLNVLHLVCRYLHIIGGMLLVGGILFYEMVVPIAISDLKEEVQIAVFARARWVFRWIVWTGAAILLLTGADPDARKAQCLCRERVPAAIAGDGTRAGVCVVAPPDRLVVGGPRPLSRIRDRGRAAPGHRQPSAEAPGRLAATGPDAAADCRLFRHCHPPG